MLNSWLQDGFNEFKQAFLSNHLPGAVIIAGNMGLGTIDLALAMCRLYLCQSTNVDENCSTCRSCTLFDASSHPDFKAVLPSNADEAEKGLDLSNNLEYIKNIAQTPQGRFIRINSLRQVTHYLNESAVIGKKKVVLITHADLMQEGAANAILKTFEEPPLNTLIIMLTKSLEDLLPTILSRAYKIIIKDVPLKESLDFLAKYGVDKNIAKKAIAISGGVPYMALKIIDNKDIDKIVAFMQNFVALTLNVKACNKENAIVEILMSMNDHVRWMFLNELIIEILKYKAHFALDDLFLLDEQSAKILAKLPKDYLFEALAVLKNLNFTNEGLPLKTHESLVRSWIKALQKK